MFFFLSSKVNFQKILDNLVAFLQGFAKESATLKHSWLSQFSINTLFIAITSYLCCDIFLLHFCLLLWPESLLLLAQSLWWQVCSLECGSPLVCSIFREGQELYPYWFVPSEQKLNDTLSVYSIIHGLPVCLC